MIKKVFLRVLKKIKQYIFNSFYNSTLSEILLSLIVGLFFIMNNSFIPESEDNTIRKIVLLLMLCIIVSLRLVLSIKSGNISFKKK